MASTSGTNTVRDNSILRECNALYLSFNGLLSQPPPLHWKKIPLIYYQVPGRQIDSTSFNISSDLQLSNDKPHQCHCPGYLTAKMKIQKHKSHADKKTAPFVPPIHSYSIKLPKPILSAIPTKTSDISAMQCPLNRNSGNKDTNYMLAILDSRMKIVAHERFQYVLLKKFGE